MQHFRADANALKQEMALCRRSHCWHAAQHHCTAAPCFPLQAKLNLIDPTLFPLHDMAQDVATANLPANAVVGSNMLRYHLRPLAKKGVDTGVCGSESRLIPSLCAWLRFGGPCHPYLTLASAYP